MPPEKKKWKKKKEHIAPSNGKYLFWHKNEK